MKRTVLMTGALAATAMALSPGVTYAASAGGAPTSGTGASPGTVVRSDNRPDPLQSKQAELRRTAVDKLIKGEAKTAMVNGKRVIVVDDGKRTAAQQRARGKNAKAAKPKYVEYDPQQTANIFTVLTDFGTKVDPTAGGSAGPQHNQIPEPDRTIDGTVSDDNSTYWEKDFNQAHYQKMMFGATGESFANFYKSQSQGRYKAQGTVSDWVTVPYNEARYGSNTGSEADRYWSYIGDTATGWYNAQKAAGKTAAQIKAELKKYDVWDRYDYDHDGNFDEPDGYIDHFQAIHAGEGEEAGGGAQGADAIWSHRWAVQTGAGKAGPTGNLNGGTQIGDTGVWIRDYTTEPENGGLGVFAHEYGHDLGLPDLYDTTNTSTNSVSFWSLMNSGSWLNHGGNAIGTTPGYMGAWEKTQLGWSDTKTVRYGNSGKVSLGPADKDSATKPQTLAISLPDKTLATKYNTPKTGSYEWWSGRDDDLNNSLTRSVDLTGATTGKVSASVWYDIEADYDYLYGQVSTDGGATWNNVGTPLTGTGTGWSTVSYDLTPYAGKKLTFRFLYQTDGGTNGAGAFLDDIATTVGTTTTTDGAESASSVWTPQGFTRMNGTDTRVATNYYLAESRRYSGYDTTLKQGPYNFGFGPRRPDVVEHFPYQDGVLIWYVNNEFKDNNTSAHPGGGLVLPVDAHATPMVWPDGVAVSNRIQPYDATFGLDRTDSFTLHKQGLAATVPARAAVATFDDTNPNAYYFAANPAGSVKVAGSGTRIKVTAKQGDGYALAVSFPKSTMRTGR